MADGRMLKKAVSNSRRLAELSSDTARLIYTWLIPHLDVEGRFTAEPSIIKGNVFPRIKTINEKVISKTLKEMDDLRLITIYKVDGDAYFQLRKFEDHQTGLRKEREAPSKIPAPTPDQLRSNSALREEKRSIREEKRREEDSGGTPDQTDKPKKWGEELKEIFNSATQYLPKVTEIGKTRLEHITARIKEGRPLDWWKTVFTEADTILLPGKDDRKDWHPTFDWLIKNDTNAVKVFEGNYRDAKRPQMQGKKTKCPLCGKLWGECEHTSKI